MALGTFLSKYLGEGFTSREVIDFLPSRMKGEDALSIDGAPLRMVVVSGTQQLGRNNWADICRFFSIYGVVLIHSCGATFYQYGRIPLHGWLQSVLLDSLVRCSVPLFVMLSGALILNRHSDRTSETVDISQIMRRCVRIVVPLLAWSLIYLMHLARNGVEVHIASILVKPAMYHLWFGYMIVGIYLLLPVLRPVFASTRKSTAQIGYFVLLWLILTSLPVYWPIPLLPLLQQENLFGYGGYFLLGGLMASRARIPLSTPFWLVIFVIATVVTVFATWYQSDRAGAPVETAFIYFSPNVVMASVAAFVLFSRVRVGRGWAVAFMHLSNCSFLVYFVHVLMLEYVRYSATVTAISESLPVGVSILLVSFMTLIMSLVISLVRFIPGVSRVLG